MSENLSFAVVSRQNKAISTFNPLLMFQIIKNQTKLLSSNSFTEIVL